MFIYRKENVEASDNYGTYEKHDKYEKYDKYDKYDKFEKYDKYEKYPKPDKYDKFDKFEKYDKFGGGKYDKFSKHDKYESYAGGSNYESGQRGYQKKDFNSTTHRDYDKSGFNDNRKYSATYRESANNPTPVSDKRGYISGKKFDKYPEGKYPDNKYSDQKFDKFDKYDKYEATATATGITNTNYTYKKEGRDTNKKPFKDSNEAQPKPVTIDAVFNTNTNYCKKTQVEEEHTFDRAKNISSGTPQVISTQGATHTDKFTSGNYTERRDRDYYKNDDRKKFNPHKDQGHRDRDFHHHGKDTIEKRIDHTFDDLKKPVFINSSKLQKDNEKGSAEHIEEKHERDSEHKKGIPITNMLKVPLNQIDEKIHNSKEKYIQQQMSHVNILANVPERENPANTSNISGVSHNNSGLDSIHSSNKSNKAQTPNTSQVHTPNPYQGNTPFAYHTNPNQQINPQINPQASYPPNQYYQMPRPVMYNSYIPQAGQQPVYKYPPYNMPPMMQPQPQPGMNQPINPQVSIPPINVPAQPLYNNNQLTNYYSSSVPINYMFPNYYPQNAGMSTQQAEPEELDVKEFSDKLNLNAKVYVPKNKV